MCDWRATTAKRCHNNAVRAPWVADTSWSSAPSGPHHAPASVCTPHAFVLTQRWGNWRSGVASSHMWRLSHAFSSAAAAAIRSGRGCCRRTHTVPPRLPQCRVIDLGAADSPLRARIETTVACKTAADRCPAKGKRAHWTPISRECPCVLPPRLSRGLVLDWCHKRSLPIGNRTVCWQTRWVCRRRAGHQAEGVCRWCTEKITKAASDKANSK